MLNRVFITLHQVLSLIIPSLIILSLLSLTGCNMFKKKAPPEQFFTDPLAIEMGHAIHDEDSTKIKALTQKIDINSRGKDGITFLIWTMEYGPFFSYQTLLELGADTDLIMENGTTALDVVSTLDLPWATELVRAGVDINLSVESRPVWWLAYMGHNWPVFDYFLKQPNLNINAQDAVGRTILINVAGQGEYDQVIKLLNKGADLHLRVVNGDSFAYTVQTTVPEKGSKQYPYYQEVLKRMKAQGIVLPVKGPRELQQDREQKGQ